MTGAFSLRELAALEAHFYIACFRRRDDQQTASALAFGLTPYASMFVREAKKWQGQGGMTDSEHETTLRAARLRVKLLDDDVGVHRVRDRMDALQLRHRRFFLKPRSVWIAWLARRLETDLGLSLAGDRLVCTTHVADANVALSRGESAAPLEPSSNAPALKEWSRAVGGQLGAIARGLGEREVTASPPPPVRTRDVKSELYYGRVAAGFAPGRLLEALMLTDIRVALNFLDVTLRALRPPFPVHFKLKVLTLHHALKSLRKLQSLLWPTRALTPGGELLFKGLVGRLGDAPVLMDASKFRNLLAHLEAVGGVPSTDMDAAARMLCGGRDVATIDDLCERVLRHLTVALEGALSDGVS